MGKQENNEGVVIVKYKITEELVNQPIPFLRAHSRIKPSEGINAVYVDDGPRTPAKSTIRFDNVGEHIVRIRLTNSRVIPEDFLRHAEHIYSVEIPESVTEIKEMAFRWTHLQCPPALPPHLAVIGECAFDGAYVGVECVQVPDLSRKIRQARHRDARLQRRIARALRRSTQPEITPIGTDRTLVLDKGRK